jgi:hypothetical protein
MWAKIKEFFANLADDPTIRGFLSIFKALGEQTDPKQERRKQATLEMAQKGLLTGPESRMARFGMSSSATNKKIDDYLAAQKKQSPLVGMQGELAMSEERRRKVANEYKYRMNRAAEAANKALDLDKYKNQKVLNPNTKVGDDTEIDKPKKEKNTNLLEMIVQNTSKANELTLRNMTYGGGQLAAEGVSSVQMANYRTVSSPRINATNDINRGIKKEVNATIGSNFLNFSPRRS